MTKEEKKQSQDETPMDKMQRNAYLHSKGINPNAPMQLDLIFSDLLSRNDLRHIPNDCARSSLFTTRHRREPRKAMQQEKLFSYNESVELQYTGIELRAEDDELIWLQMIHYGRTVAMGEPYVFTVKEIVKDLGWAKNGRNYDRVRESISRLKANEIKIKNTKAYGKGGSMSLIQEYEEVNDEDGKAHFFSVYINPNLIALFAGNTFSSHHWLSYRELSPVARRLADYIQSHKHPFNLDLNRFRKMCGSSTLAMKSWTQTVKKACQEVVEKNIIDVCGVSDGSIYFINNKQLT